MSTRVKFIYIVLIIACLVVAASNIELSGLVFFFLYFISK